MDIMEVLGQLFAELSDEELEIVHREAAHEIEQRTTTTVYGICKVVSHDGWGGSTYGAPIRLFTSREAAEDYMREHGYERQSWGGYVVSSYILEN